MSQVRSIRDHLLPSIFQSTDNNDTFINISAAFTATGKYNQYLRQIGIQMKRSDMMRCPNCSFLNPDDAVECKICGYELTPSTSNPESELPKKMKRNFDDDEDLDKTVDALFGEMPAQKKPKDKGVVKRIDKRFEAYADMPDSEDDPISEDELRWLERLQRDIKQVDDEFDRMRRKNTGDSEAGIGKHIVDSTVDSSSHTERNPHESEHIKSPGDTDYLSEQASPNLAEDTKVFKGEHTFDTHKFKPSIIEVDESVPEVPDRENTEVKPQIHSQTPVTPVNETIIDHKMDDSSDSATIDAFEDHKTSDHTIEEEAFEKAEATYTSETDFKEKKPVDNFEKPNVHPQDHHHTVDGEEVIHLNFTVSGAPETSPQPASSSKVQRSLEADDEETHINPNAHRNRMIIFAVLAVILIIIFLKMFIRTTPEEPAEPINATPSVNTPVEAPSSAETIAEQTGIFFGQLQSYVNDGNIAVLSMFEDSQNALEQLAAFKAIGTLDDFTLSMPETIDVVDSKADVTVTVSLNRTIDGSTVQNDSAWTFNWEEVEGTWRISTLVITSQEGSTTVDNNENTPSNSNSGSTTTATTTTTAEKPEGFIATGSFSGGIVTDGQDVSGIRFGKHELFERVVLDLSVWTGGTPTERVEEACQYDAKISDDGKSVILTLSGARGVSAGTPDLSRSTFFKSVEASFPEDDSTVSFEIVLNQTSEYKVFQLKSPGKIVIDVMPK
ncbi:hypothetical protein KHM83_04045 [Fusibacter paucivorans]|uniref:AMIN-like domain-containing protein n=1 Tax=Fusibacter paucivorans TaxID=76009 RepID=A0ABS5PNB3_9FIRM|nr:nuclear transport factor 2 family protein [Fusibacter paucivorans]MBS7525846.1 hypothetical protein [Fusibacter paucivorans]